MKYVVYYTTTCSPKRKANFLDFNDALDFLSRLASKDYFVKGYIEAVQFLCLVSKKDGNSFSFHSNAAVDLVKNYDDNSIPF